MDPLEQVDETLGSLSSNQRPQPAADQRCTACDGHGDEGSTYMNSGKCQTCHGTGTQPVADQPTTVPVLTREEVLTLKELAKHQVMVVPTPPEEAFTIRPALTRGAQRIAAERARQAMDEGYQTTIDAVINRDNPDMLARAATCYALPAHERAGRVDLLWPWPADAWKPTPGDRIRELEKAGALIAAEIDRLLYEQDLKSPGDRHSDDL